MYDCIIFTLCNVIGSDFNWWFSTEICVTASLFWFPVFPLFRTFGGTFREQRLLLVSPSSLWSQLSITVKGFVYLFFLSFLFSGLLGRQNQLDYKFFFFLIKQGLVFWLRLADRFLSQSPKEFYSFSRMDFGLCLYHLFAWGHLSNSFVPILAFLF